MVVSVGAAVEVVAVGGILVVETLPPAVASLIQQQTMATRRRHFRRNVESILLICELLDSETPYRSMCSEMQATNRLSAVVI